ncbi:MAG: DUF2868 domain-containing protein [Verrucomicrobiales bacterium]
MAKDVRPWTLQGLIDFECEVADGTPTPEAVRGEVVRAVRGLRGVEARRRGFLVWLAGVRTKDAGRRFIAALALVGSVLGIMAAMAGASAVVGMLDREKGGVPVSLFLAILVGGQWLLLVAAVVGWALRGKAAEGFSLLQTLLARAARRVAGDRKGVWWGRLMTEGGAARQVVLWRLARMAQAAGVAFNGGVMLGLGGLVMLRHVGFYWETTTEFAMHTVLEKVAGFLSIPWAAWWPGAVPDVAVIDATRWLPESELAPGPAAWWQFLLMVVLFWGLLPRAVLWVVSWRMEKLALARLDFQARSHRALWRDLAGSQRVETDDKPLDGVLVLDVGGTGLSEESLRAFLLRRLRVHPAAWHPVAVIDSGAESSAAEALANAPAGVVLVAEGWSLSPPRMSRLHARIREQGGAKVPVKFLVANVVGERGDRRPEAVTDEEKEVWEAFVDSLRDPEAEVFFYQELPVIGDDQEG